MHFKCHNRQVVSKEAGGRNLQANLSPKGRSPNKGTGGDGRRKPPFIPISDQEQVSTASLCSGRQGHQQIQVADFVRKIMAPLTAQSSMGKQ